MKITHDVYVKTKKHAKIQHMHNIAKKINFQ